MDEKLSTNSLNTTLGGMRLWMEGRRTTWSLVQAPERHVRSMRSKLCQKCIFGRIFTALCLAWSTGQQ